MPLWGAKEKSVGNNPICIGIPRRKGAVVLDMAMSQFAYGKLGVYRLAGRQLPVPGGYDEDGNLTCDPGAIERSGRVLPMGYWKGSGMALALDMAAALMAAGKCGTDMDDGAYGACGGCSQVFFAYDPAVFGGEEELEAMLDRRVDAAHAAAPAEEGGEVLYPGEGSARRLRENRELGVPADERVWEQVCAIASGNLSVEEIACVCR